MPGKVESTFPARPGSEVLHALLSPDGATLAVAKKSGVVSLLRSGDGSGPRELPGSGKDPLSCLSFMPDGKTLTTGHGSGIIQFWNVADLRLSRTLKVADSAVVSLAFSSRGSVLAVGSADHVARIFEIPSGKLLSTCTGHRKPVNPGTGLKAPEWAIRSLALSLDGKVLVTASNDGTARLWDTATGVSRGVLEHDDPVTAVAFDFGGHFVFTACADGKLRAWDTATGKLRHTFRTDQKIPSDLTPLSLACSADGSYLAAVFGGRVECWDLQRILVFFRKFDQALSKGYDTCAFSVRSPAWLCSRRPSRVRGDGPRDNQTENVREIPPPGISVSAEDRDSLRKALDELSKDIESLGKTLKPALRELLSDVEVYPKAVRYALELNEFYRPIEVKIAHALLAQGRQRAEALRAGKALGRPRRGW